MVYFLSNAPKRVPRKKNNPISASNEASSSENTILPLRTHTLVTTAYARRATPITPPAYPASCLNHQRRACPRPSRSGPLGVDVIRFSRKLTSLQFAPQAATPNPQRPAACEPAAARPTWSTPWGAHRRLRLVGTRIFASLVIDTPLPWVKWQPMTWRALSARPFTSFRSGCPRGMAGVAAWVLAQELRWVSPSTGSVCGVFCCAWSLDGTHLACVLDDGDTVSVWDVHEGVPFVVASLVGHSPDGGDGATWCAWSSDSELLATASWDQTVRVWDVATWSQVARLEGHHGIVTWCAWSPDGTRFASSSQSTVRLWDVGSWLEVGTVQGGPVDEDGDVCELDNGCAWHPGGTRLVAASPYDATVRVWDVSSNTGSAVAELQCPTGTDENTCAWSPDGTLLAAGLTDMTVQVWACDTWRPVAKLEGHGGPVLMCAWSPDGRWLAAASASDVRVWDVNK